MELVQGHSSSPFSTLTRQPAVTSQFTGANSLTTGPFPLTELPLELAEEIFFHALASGNTSVLRVSHSISEGALRLRFKVGIFRIKIQERHDWFSIRSHPISTQVANLIQNIEVRIDLDGPDESRALYSGPTVPTAHFMDSSFQRDTCYIVLRTQDLRGHYEKPRYSLGQIQRLRGFKTVIVRAIAADRHRDGYSLIDVPIRVPEPINPAFTRVREKLMCEMVRGELEEVFGPGVMYKSDDGRRRLEFHPVWH